MSQLSRRSVFLLGDFTVLLAIVMLLHLLVLCAWSRILSAKRYLAGGQRAEADRERSLIPDNLMSASERVLSISRKAVLFVCCGMTGTDPDWDLPAADEVVACKGCISVPAILYWPNIEIMVIAYYAAGISSVCTSVIALSATGLLDEPGTLVCAILGWTFLANFCLHECARIAVYWQRHRHRWVRSKDVEDRQNMDDPLLILLYRMRVHRKPSLRLQGSFLAQKPEVVGEGQEPKPTDPWLPSDASKTMHALHAPLALWWRRTGDEMHLSLSSSWLFGVNGRRAVGFGFQYVRFLMQAVVGVLVGSLEAQRGARSNAWHAALAVLIVIHVLFAAYCLLVAPSADRVESIFVGMESMLPSVSLMVRYAYLELRTSKALLDASALITLAAVCTILSLAPYEVLAVGFRKLCKPRRRKGRERSSRALVGKKSRVAVEEPAIPSTPVARGGSLERAADHHGVTLQRSLSSACVVTVGPDGRELTLREQRMQELRAARSKELREKQQASQRRLSRSKTAPRLRGDSITSRDSRISSRRVSSTSISMPRLNRSSSSSSRLSEAE